MGGFSALCHIQIGMIDTGLVISFGSIIAKGYRVFRVWCNSRFSVVQIPDSALLRVVLYYAIFDVVILCAWAIFDPMKRRVVRSNSPKGSYEIVLETEHCVSNNELIWLSLLYVPKAILLLFGAYISIRTREVSLRALNDSKPIAMSLYNLGLLTIIHMFVSSQLDDPTAQALMTSTCIFVGVVVTQVVVFFPRWIEARSDSRLNGVTPNRYTVTAERSMKKKYIAAVNESKESKKDCKLPFVASQSDKSGQPELDRPYLDEHSKGVSACAKEKNRVGIESQSKCGLNSEMKSLGSTAKNTDIPRNSMSG